MQIEGGSYSFVNKAEDILKRKIILKVQDVDLRSTDGEVDRNSETQFLVLYLINTQRLNELTLSTDGLNYWLLIMSIKWMKNLKTEKKWL
jgi:hypothetical protein